MKEAERNRISTKRVKPPQVSIDVVLDTSVLFTGSESHFFRKEVADLIEQNSSLPDLTIRWIVPEIVRHERQFQMRQKAIEMLPTIAKLERLLGHNLNINAEILDRRVEEAVDNQLKKHSVMVQPLAHADVDWPRLMLDAAYRRPPFQLGETEEGFRDALILETFLQLMGTPAGSRSNTRLALVSSDQLLSDAARARLGTASDVYLLESIEALKGLINTLGSAVDEGFIARVTPGAELVFYKPDDGRSLYYKGSVGTKLDLALKSADLRLPGGADKYKVEQWHLGSPRFVKKQGQRIYWTSRVEGKLKALKSAAPSARGVPLSSLLSPNITNVTGWSGVSPSPSFPDNKTLETVYWQSLGSKVPLATLSGSADTDVGSGTASLDVSWSVVVTTAGKLTKPQLESVAFVEVVW